MTALDATLLIAVPLAVRAVIWPVIVAMAASVACITFTARNLRSVLVT